MSSKTLVAMKRVDGTLDSEVHCEGCVIKPNPDGVVWVPAEHALSLIKAGYFYTQPND